MSGQNAIIHVVQVAAAITAFFKPVYVARLIGLVLVVGGFNGWFSPVSLAKVFGVPAANENTALFFPGIGGRNAAAGLMFLFLTWRGAINGQKMRQGYAQALGMHSAVWSLAGFSDVWILMQTPQTENAMIHVLNICILLLVGSTVLWTHGLN